ncbi:hypothetical protein ACUJ46_09105 [Sandaracinobacteroides sp. A072]
MRRFLLFAPIFLLASACSGEEANEPASPTAAAAGSGSAVAEPYRTSFDRAWQNASEGRSPSQACAAVVGKAAGLLKTTATGGQERTDALEALDACYVRAMAHFVDTTLSVDNPGTTQCVSLLKALPVHRSSLGGFLADVGEVVAAYDRRLNERIEAKVRSACPDTAAIILGV